MHVFSDLGRVIKLETETKTKLIPAVNIQVENIPDGYGIYFEILFENGNLWVVMQDISKPNMPIDIIEQNDWAHDQTLIDDPTTFADNWDQFLDLYELACL